MKMENSNISIAFSGGGTRAMAFHAGVLLYLAEKDCLEKVQNISSVSGGSLLVGLIYCENNYKWPSSKEYKNNVYSSIKSYLCNTNIQLNAIIKLFNPFNWKYLLSRANIIAKTIQNKWKIYGSLNEIPSFPRWIINGTTAETGKRFSFEFDKCGDYTLGYFLPKDIKISEAISISAAFPGGIGPFALKTDQYDWKKKIKWADPDGSEVDVKLDSKYIHIYDGGVYDNLGTEPFFDHGIGKLKIEETFLIVSDAGSRLSPSPLKGSLNPSRLKRIVDISMEQVRSLRVRSLMCYFTKVKNNGSYIMIGENPKDILSKYELGDSKWQSIENINDAMNYKTKLSKMSETDFLKISRNGYELAKSLYIIKNGF